MHRLAIPLLVVVAMMATSSCGSSRRLAGKSNCGADLVAHWSGHALPLDSCAGKLGLDSTISLSTGDEITLTGFAPSPVEDLRSSDAGVLTRRPLAPKSGLARFKAVRPGRADIVGDTTMCLTSNEKTACPVAHIVVAARK